MADNRPTVGWIVINDFWGGMSRIKGNPAYQLFNTNPVAEVFPTSSAALKAIAVTVAEGRRRRIRLESWKRKSFRVLRAVRARP